MENQKASKTSIERQWAGIRMAHEAVMLGDAQASLAQDRAAVREHQAMLRSQVAEDRQDSVKENEAMIHIGDYIVQPLPQKSSISAGPRSSRSRLAKAGLAVAAVAVGGIGVGAPLALSWLLQQTPGEPLPASIDQDTQFELKLIPDE